MDGFLVIVSGFVASYGQVPTTVFLGDFVSGCIGNIIVEIYLVFQASWAAFTLILAVSSVKGGNGGRESLVMVDRW